MLLKLLVLALLTAFSNALTPDQEQSEDKHEKKASSGTQEIETETDIALLHMKTSDAPVEDLQVEDQLARFLRVLYARRNLTVEGQKIAAKIGEAVTGLVKYEQENPEGVLFYVMSKYWTHLSSYTEDAPDAHTQERQKLMTKSIFVKVIAPILEKDELDDMVWEKSCRFTGADGHRGLTKEQFFKVYNALVQKGSSAFDSIVAELDKLWRKLVPQGQENMTKPEFFKFLKISSDSEPTDSEWESECEQLQADPHLGITKAQFFTMYSHDPESSMTDDLKTLEVHIRRKELAESLGITDDASATDWILQAALWVTAVVVACSLSICLLAKRRCFHSTQP